MAKKKLIVKTPDYKALTVNIPYHGSMVRIHSCYKSGLSIPSWCKEKGITPGTFYGWIKQVSNKGYDVSTFTRHGTAYKWRVF